MGCDIYIARGDCFVCPLGNYFTLCGPAPGPLFCYEDGRPLTRQLLSSTVQSILHSARYSCSYSSHSFRIGAVTIAASRGIPNHLIKTLGRWSRDAYLLYIRTPVDFFRVVPTQRSFSLANRARGWVVGRTDLSGVLPPWVWVGGSSPWSPGHPSSTCDAGINLYQYKNWNDTGKLLQREKHHPFTIVLPSKADSISLQRSFYIQVTEYCNYSMIIVVNLHTSQLDS